MTPFAAVAVKTVSAAAAAAILGLGVVQAASPTPAPTRSASTKAPAAHDRADRRAIGRAVFESEADVLGITPGTLRSDLRKGQKVSALARDKGMTKEHFQPRLTANVNPPLPPLSHHTVLPPPH